MKLLVMFSLASLLISCGTDPKAAICSVNCMGYRIATADEVIGQQTNHARKHLSDREINAENVFDQMMFSKDHTGKKANEVRKYTYRRGPKEIMHGDKDSTNTVYSSNSSTTESRLTALEALYELQSSILELQSEKIEALEAGSSSEATTTGGTSEEPDLSDYDSRLDQLESALDSLEALIGSMEDETCLLEKTLTKSTKNWDWYDNTITCGDDSVTFETKEST